MAGFYKTGDVQKATGATYRQLEHWDKSGFISPSYRRGIKRSYCLHDIIEVNLAVEMKKAYKGTNATKDAIAKLRATVKQLTFPITLATVYCDRKGIILYTGEMADSTPDKNSVKVNVKDLVTRLLENNQNS